MLYPNTLTLVFASISLLFIAPHAKRVLSNLKSSLKRKPKFVLCIHGGAGLMARNVVESRREKYKNGLDLALKAGGNILEAGGSALEAVEAAVVVLEGISQYT